MREKMNRGKPLSHAGAEQLSRPAAALGDESLSGLRIYDSDSVPVNIQSAAIRIAK